MSYYEQKIAALEARIEEMAKLERMKAVKVEAQLMDRLGELKAENARLKAEVERLEKMVTHLDNTLNRYALDDWRMKAQVERLIKAGDAMLREWASGEETNANNFRRALLMWNAAKEGKQP